MRIVRLVGSTFFTNVLFSMRGYLIFILSAIDVLFTKDWRSVMARHKKKRKKRIRKSSPRMSENTLTKFHIIPKSLGGTGGGNNISLVPLGLHREYHNLFGLLTPPEIINYLVDYFWNGQWKYVLQSLDKK